MDVSPSAVSDPLGLTDRSHPLRASLSYEMHVRKLPRFASPCRLLQIVTMLGEGGGEASHAHAAALCGRAGRTLAANAKYALIEDGAMRLVWERHTEFATYTFVRPGEFDQPFAADAFADMREVLAAMPGEIVRATLIALIAAPAIDAAMLDADFDPDGLVACEVADGKATIYSNFTLGADGLGRLLIADKGLAGDEPAQLVQRLQELGNYRNMALFGLPLAQRLTPEVTRLERRLALLTRDVSDAAVEDEPLLHELTSLSAELARLLAETRYRMSATRAYAQLSAERLASLGVGAIAGHQTLADFTERRLMPAVRTCASFSERLEDLSQRASWTSSLLRTRIDTALARQNRDLLASMDRRTDLQFRLQRTVEGLSIVAISYYAVALLGDILRAVPGVSHDLATAVAVPFIVATVAFMLSRVRRRID